MFGASRTSQKIIAIADIGTGSAGVALVLLKAAEPARVIAAERIALPFEKRTADATAKGILANLGQAAEKTLTSLASGEHKNGRVSGLYAVVHAPWTSSVTLRASSQYEKETKIGNMMIGEVAQQAIADAKDLDRPTLMESAVVRVELNGYPCASPVGKSAHDLSVAVLASTCDSAIRNGMDEALGRAFPGIKPVYRSGARALISVLRALPRSTDEYVVLDMQGEASAIIVVRGGIAADQVLVPEGVRTLLTRVSENGLPEETLSLIRMLERDECSSESCEAISTAMAKAEIDLSKVFGDELTKIANPARLPADLVIAAPPDLSPWLSRFFTRIDFTQCTVTARPFAVHALMPENIATLAIEEAGVTADLELLISSALVNIEENA